MTYFVAKRSIKQQLDRGLFNNASELVRDALRLKMQQGKLYQIKFEALPVL